MRNSRHLLAWILWATFCTSSVASAPQGIRHEKLSNVHLTILGFTIGQHTLEDIQKVLGKAKFLTRREQAPKRICYVSGEKQNDTIVIFEAGPIGGWEMLTAITIASGKVSFKERSSCTVASQVSTNVSTEGGLKLGLDRAGLEAILGNPSRAHGSTLHYEFRAREKMTEKQIQKLAKLWPKVGDDPYMDVSSDVEAIFSSDSRLESVTISKIETY